MNDILESKLPVPRWTWTRGKGSSPVGKHDEQKQIPDPKDDARVDEVPKEPDPGKHAADDDDEK